MAKENSREFPGIQVADVFTGAITASHNLYLDPTAEVNAGKRLLIERLAAVLGWEDLATDTFPQSQFNIWNFPWEDYRNRPGSKDIVPNLTVPYVAMKEI